MCTRWRRLQDKLPSTLSTISLFAVLSYFAWRNTKEKGRQCLFGAFIALMVLTPVYTYEHHLVFMLLPVVLVARNWKGMGYPLQACVLLSYFFLTWPLTWLREVQTLFPQLHWWIQESKFIACCAIAILCVYCSFERAKCSSAFSSGEREA